MKTVRIGVVGLGWWACDTHIPNLLQLRDVAIAALCSRKPENVQRGRQALKGQAEPFAFSDYDELLASDAVDAVVICTPNYMHSPMTLAAVWAGKHVGVELRYGDVAQTMRHLITEGAIGEPAIPRTDVWRQWGAPGNWRADESKCGGLFHELGVHYIDLLGFLAGQQRPRRLHRPRRRGRGRGICPLPLRPQSARPLLPDQHEAVRR